MFLLLCLGSTTDAKTLSASTTSPGGNAMQKKSILVGKRPGLGVSSMLNQFKSYSQSKRNPVLSPRPSVFCSPDDEDEEGDADYSRFLELKGNLKHLFFNVTLENSLVRTFLILIQSIICHLLVTGILS